MRAWLAFAVVALSAHASPAVAQSPRARSLEHGMVEILAHGAHAAGFVVGEEHWIITTFCGVEATLQAHPRDPWVDVRFASRTTRRARVVRADVGHDLALLVVDGATVPGTPLAFSTVSVDVGRVLSTREGPGVMVSAAVVGRRSGTEAHAPDVPDLIRTERVLGTTPGTPLVDAGGRVVAVSVANERTPSDAGVAIPIDYVRAFVDAVRSSQPHGTPTLAELGITAEDGVEGVLVLHVDPDSAAERAGVGGTDAPMRLGTRSGTIPAGEVITELAGTRVTTVADLEAALAGCRRGVPIGIVIRQGRSPTAPSSRATLVLDVPLR